MTRSVDIQLDINKMYIRIEFDDIESAKTKETQELFCSIPNGMFLTSSNAHMIYLDEMKERKGYSVMFWHLDVDILNKHYGGVMRCLNSLLRYPGVSHVDVLPVEGHYDSFSRNFDELTNALIKYIDNV